jgi:hypothetical protein
MNTLILQLKKVTPLCLIVSVLAGFAPLPMALALLPPPPPDGGYPNGNTAEGDGALFNNTTGSFNVEVEPDEVLVPSNPFREPSPGEPFFDPRAEEQVEGSNAFPYGETMFE